MDMSIIYSHDVFAGSTDDALVISDYVCLPGAAPRQFPLEQVLTVSAAFKVSILFILQCAQDALCYAFLVFIG